ncbi:MAG: MBL fold metallo-hydrolase [Phycisphaerales bacterium]|nr:MBL fold metallo-hydrolase [Phycisphaerales bacterium]
MGRRLIEHQLDDIRLLGYSVAGEETVVAAPELNVCFDVGKAPAEILSIDHVLLSHGHMDHAAGLAYYFSQRNFVGNAPGCAVVPEALVAPIKNLLKVWGDLEGHVSPARIVGLKPGDDFEIRRGLIARTFEINHGVPALGFCVVDVRRKLKPEFDTKTGPELVELKKQGIEIEYSVEVPLIAFCGDTAEGSWLELEMVRRAKVLILECTFFEAEHIRRARHGYHLHVRDVARIVNTLENDHIVISHVTRRTGIREAKHALAKVVNESTASRITFLMDGRRSRPHQREQRTQKSAP